MGKRILFYSSVDNVDLFNVTGFYVEDIKALRMAGYYVVPTNKYLDFFKFWKYDVSLLYFYTKSFIPAVISKLFSKKIIFTGGIDILSLQDSGVNNGFKFYIIKSLFLFNYLMSTYCNIVSLSDLKNVKKALYNFGVKNCNKLVCFPHSVNLLQKKYEQVISNKNKVITTICWMKTIGNVKRKGLDNLLLAFKEILSFDNEYSLCIIGDFGDGKSYLESIVDENGLANSVLFTGQVSEEEKIDLLMKSKYYFQLSTYEGFGLAPLEACAYFNVIFHTNVGGLKETVGSLNTVIIDNAKDVNEIVSKFIKAEEGDANEFFNLKENAEAVFNRYSTIVRSNHFKEIIEQDANRK